MTGRCHCAGFSLAEMMIAMLGSSMILGALLFSSMQLQKALHASERYAASQSDQRRLLDYLSRDIRRAIAISTATTVNGTGGMKLAGASAKITGSTALVVTLPGYYQSDQPGAGNYDEALPVVATNNYVDYGNDAGHAPGVKVIFRKEFVSSERSECFVRFEADARTIVVRQAENLALTVAVTPDGRGCDIDVTFTTPNGRSAPISSHDQILLRNIRTD